MFCPIPENCDILQGSDTFSVAVVLLQSTSEAICNGTIAVHEVRVITCDPRSQKNFEEIVNSLYGNGHAETIVRYVQVAKEHLQTFEQERSQVLTLTKRLQGYCQAEAKSKL